ncbi:MAG: fimbrillin family protein [Muribaculaceae bacterium]|nr:fimbrillin family protein [Muribaculaceae bacterium]
MRHFANKYIYLSSLALLTVGACSDDLLYPDGADPTDPNAVKYAASVGRAFGASTRGGDEPLYEPLIATSDDGNTKLYLHTYETDKIGERPGEDEPKTRGYQVESVDDLVKYHTDFFAHAKLTATNEEYIGWVRAKAQSFGSNIWLSDKTEYWPADEQLSFHAVAPSAEFGSLQSLSCGRNDVSFRYTAKKGNGKNDAQTQKDLLIAASTCNKAGSVQGKAPLQFHHALSSIKFAIRDVMGGTVRNIKITGVYGTGDCYYKAEDSGDNGAFTWTNLANKQAYGQDFNYKVPDRIVGDLNSNVQDLLMYQDLPENTFMLIPQQIPDDAMVEITIEFDATKDMASYTKTVKAHIKDNMVQEWKPGHEYVYTISTSADNWVYVFQASGNHISPNGPAKIPNFNNKNHANVKDNNDYTAATNNHGDNSSCNIIGDMIYVFSPSRDRHDTYNDDAYYRVRSFRYRANNHQKIEDLPWTADYDLRGEQWREITTNTYEYVSKRDLEAEMNTTWITDTHSSPFKGKGDHSTHGELHKITMAAHYQMTDWKGDQWMDDNDEYPGTSESKPWDLSTCGTNNFPRTTANCYVIDRPGWYSFPLIYGNAVKDGKVNSASYYYSTSNSNYLKNFKDYKNNDITSHEIPNSQCVSADVVWSDVYNVITPGSVKLVADGSRKKIVFQANRGNMQQGNVVIALYDKNGTIVWSWHIWITEHWLEPGTGIPDYKKNPSSCFAYQSAMGGSGWRERGDVKISVNNKSKRMAAYNLGWCDPKNVDYLRRPATMTFVQQRPNGKTATIKLPIIQDGERVQYKFGNNTYYQFGRKDPMVGFMDHNNEVKRNFGPKQYDIQSQPVSIHLGIQNPHILYAKGDYNKGDKVISQWTNSKYTHMNYWNNSTNSLTSNTVVKTVYDPCPPGYVVPPACILEFIGLNNDNNYEGHSNNTLPLKHFNGEQVDEFTFKIKKSPNSNFNNENVVWFTSTGNRWFTDNFPNDALKDFKGGDNFNPQLCYLWSCTVFSTDSKHIGVGIALGLDNHDEKGNNKYCITPRFQGRRSMARPVRAVRE